MRYKANEFSQPPSKREKIRDVYDFMLFFESFNRLPIKA
jgi:hypothetical protein